MLVRGIIFTLITGLAWTGVGICFSHVVKKNIHFTGFMLLYSLVISVAAWIFFPDYAKLGQVTANDWKILLLTMLPCGLFGMAGFMMMRTAMASGHHGVVWALAQSAVVVPCLFAVTVFHERIGWPATVGVGLLVAGMAMLSAGRKSEGNVTSRGWLVMALCSFLLIGIGQTFSLLPSYLKMIAAGGSLRVPLVVSAGIVWLVPVIWQRRGIGMETVIPALIYAALVLIGQYGLFQALDAMSVCGAGSLVYPLAIGISIVMFALYSRFYLREKAGVVMISGIVAMAGGIILMAHKQ